uniref:Uncharacterized protein n=1 Tax=Parascaris equorum TaxID=6256 RepID=A0A914RFX7_PAREQ
MEGFTSVQGASGEQRCVHQWGVSRLRYLR